VTTNADFAGDRWKRRQGAKNPGRSGGGETDQNVPPEKRPFCPAGGSHRALDNLRHRPQQQRYGKKRTQPRPRRHPPARTLRRVADLHHGWLRMRSHVFQPLNITEIC
jgi:hypothetical protein